MFLSRTDHRVRDTFCATSALGFLTGPSLLILLSQNECCPPPKPSRQVSHCQLNAQDEHGRDSLSLTLIDVNPSPSIALPTPKIGSSAVHPMSLFQGLNQPSPFQQQYPRQTLNSDLIHNTPKIRSTVPGLQPTTSSGPLTARSRAHLTYHLTAKAPVYTPA